MRRISLGVTGLIVSNILALGMTASFYFIGTRVTPEYRAEFAHVARMQESGDTEKAIAGYHDLYKRYGIESCDLYYNLGNAYYKLGQPGRALQYFRKARRLKPGDRQVNHNIAFIEEQLGVENKELDEANPGGRSFLKKLVGFYSIYGWTVLSVANFWRFCISLVLLVFFGWRRKFFVYLSLVLCIIFLLGLALTGTKAWLDMETRQGVVVQSGVSAMYEHDAGGEEAFPLFEGQVVRVQSGWKDWIEVRLDDGRIGWVRKDDIGEI